MSKIFEAIKSMYKEHRTLFLILLASFITRIIYVFHYTDYKNYLYTDMGGYWNRALDRYNGNIFNEGQWAMYAPFYHFYLAFIFKILQFLNLFALKLEAIILLNIVYSTISIVFVYLISKQIIKNNFYSNLATGLYAFSYPLIYFNSFIMSENISIPILITSVYLIFTYHEKKLMMTLAGLIFALGVATKPAMLLIAAVFLLYIIYAHRRSFDSTIRGILFALGFCFVIFLVIVENNHISRGVIKTLYANSGELFFLTQCNYSAVNSTYSNSNGNFIWIIAPPLLWTNRNLSPFNTDHPPYDNKYFYKLGFDCIKNNPDFLIDALKKQKGLFFNSLMPSDPRSQGFDNFINFSNYLTFFMALSLGLLYYLRKDNEIDTKKIIVLLFILLSIPFTTLIYPPEQRYLLPVFFIIYLLFFTVVFNLKKYKKEATDNS